MKESQDPKDGELCLRKANDGEILVEARDDTDVHIVCCTWVFGRKSNRTISQPVRSAVSLRRAGEQLY